MTHDQDERFVVAFERVASALAGIHETQQKWFERKYPEPRGYREATVSRIPTTEDIAKEAQGANNNPIVDWYSDLAEEVEEPFIGERERKFLEHNASPQNDGGSASRPGRAQEAAGDTGSSGGSSTDQPFIEEG